MEAYTTPICGPENFKYRFMNLHLTTSSSDQNCIKLETLWIQMIVVTMSFMHDRLTTTTNEETVFHDFLEEMFPRYGMPSAVYRC